MPTDSPPEEDVTTSAPDEAPLDVDLDDLLGDDPRPAMAAPSAIPEEPESLEQLAAEVQASSSELTYLDTGADYAKPVNSGAAVSPPPVEDLEDTGEVVVSYSEPAIAPAPDRPYRPTPIVGLRVPDIPDLDLHVAAALETVAQRIRAGELHLPPVEGVGDEASSLALALAALLATRH